MKQEKSFSESLLRESLGAWLFPFRVAWRYLYAKKTHHAINIISFISSAGVCVGTMALVCVLSVMNGFENLIASLFSAFDPDLKITLVAGKTFSIDEDAFEHIRQHPSVVSFTEVLEDNALLRFNDKQMPVLIKGVSEDFKQMTRIDSIMYDGKFQLFDGGFDRSVPGLGVAHSLGLSPHFIDPLLIYAPKRHARINPLRPEKGFNERKTFVSGIFSVQQVQYDESCVLVSINLARELFEYDSLFVSAVELKLAEGVNHAELKAEFGKLLGSRFSVKNRYEQHESFYNIMRIEKWITFLILCFILLIASFNIIASLSMLIIDKQDDVQTLRALGADTALVKRIFLLEGWLVSIIGASVGIVLGAGISLLQQEFGIIKMGSGYVVEAYPMILQLSDLFIVFATVLVLGLLAAYYPVRYLSSQK